MSKKDRDLIRPYEADGIQEFDNPMPGWWVLTLWLTIIFSVIYMIYYHVLDKGSLLEELAEGRKQQQELQVKAGAAAAVVPLTERLQDQANIAAGKPIYATNCAACHGPEGQGTVGPNLTDAYWLNGGSPEAVWKSVSVGIPAKGMMAWKPVLGDQKVTEVTAYILSLRGTSPPNPKAAQGEMYEGP